MSQVFINVTSTPSFCSSVLSLLLLQCWFLLLRRRLVHPGRAPIGTMLNQWCLWSLLREEQTESSFYRPRISLSFFCFFYVWRLMNINFLIPLRNVPQNIIYKIQISVIGVISVLNTLLLFARLKQHDACLLVNNVSETSAVVMTYWIYINAY